MNNQAAQTMPELPGPFDVIEQVDKYNFVHNVEVYTADQMHQYARDYAAMLAAAPAAIGGEDDRSGWCRIDGCVHKKFGEPTWKEGDSPFQSSPHPDALQDGTLSKSTAKRVEAMGASDGERTIQQRGLADPNPYKASESPLLTNPEWGVQLNSPASASVSERARELVTELYGDKAVFTRHDVARALEQALTQQRRECEAAVEILGWKDNATPRLRFLTKIVNLPAGTKLYTTPQPSADAVREVIGSMRNFADVADKCELTEGNAQVAIRAWVTQLETLLSGGSHA